MNWLLIFIPVAVALEHLAPGRHLWVFGAAGLAIIPLAGWMGQATEQLAERVGSGIGGLLNATFGNAAELTIAIVALRGGLYQVVEASLVGAIVANTLLVIGASMLVGGLRRQEQHFNAVGTRSQATMLTLAAVALILPAAFRLAGGSAATAALGPLSVGMSVVLLVVYALDMVFSLGTHRMLFSEEHGATEHAAEEQAAQAEHEAPWSVGRAALVLAGATALVVWMSEILVGALEPAAKGLGLNDAFVGVFVLAVLGGAAEISAAIRAAMKNRIELSLSIGIGASVQVALFVAPLLVLLSYVVGPARMDLAFSGGLVLTVLLAVLVTVQVAGDGRADWLKGVQLLAVYLILAMVYYFLPTPAVQ
jgi:Ca2+:H+ antiporter